MIIDFVMYTNVKKNYEAVMCTGQTQISLRVRHHITFILLVYEQPPAFWRK